MSEDINGEQQLTDEEANLNEYLDALKEQMRKMQMPLHKPRQYIPHAYKEKDL